MRLSQMAKENLVPILGIVVAIVCLAMAGCSSGKQEPKPVYPLEICLPDGHERSEAFTVSGLLCDVGDLPASFILERKEGHRCQRFGINLYAGPIKVVVIPTRQQDPP
jgi:hypothetical protein